MNYISWNIIGLNGPGKKRVLKSRLLFDKLEILLIQETKLDMTNLTHLQKNCFKQYSYTADQWGES